VRGKAFPLTIKSTFSPPKRINAAAWAGFFFAAYQNTKPGSAEEDHMNVDATYPLNIAAKAAGFTERQIRRKIEHGFLPLQRCDKTSTGRGDYAGYSRNRILQAAIMRWLAAVNVPASTASDAALKFSDEGQTGRAPGETFEYGKTILIITPDGTTVCNLDYSASLFDIPNGVLIAIDLNKVVADVDAILNNSN
jgi:hypothetical protein